MAEDGTFSWRRITGKKIAVTFTAGELISNRIVIARKRNHRRALMRRSLPPGVC